MIVVYNFFFYLLQILSFAIIARALISWISPSMDNPIMKILYEVTEPVLAPLRHVVPRLGMFDITPIVALLLIQFIQSLLPKLFGGF
jgi:YggT family protein